MGDKSDPSDDERFETDDNDSDFNIDDCRDDVDSDDSSEGLATNASNHKRLGDDVPRVDDYDDDNDDEKEYVGPVLPGGHRFDRKFICIKYPGNVVNPEKAIETLGGITAVSTAVSKRNRRLELRFRPDDGYCKPACGDRHATTGFLLRLKIKRKNIKNPDGTVKLKKTCSEVVEVIDLGAKLSGNNDGQTNEARGSEGLGDSSDTSRTTGPNGNVENRGTESSLKPEGTNNSMTRFDVENLLNELTHRIEDCNVQFENVPRETSKGQRNAQKMESNIDSQATSNKGTNYGEEGTSKDVESETVGIDSSETQVSENKTCSGSEKNLNTGIEDTKRDESSSLPFENNKYEDLSEYNDYELPESKVLGQVDTEFKFMNLCDFQFLPITPSLRNPKEHECIYEALYPVNVPPYRWLRNKVPYFLPPAAFSRMDNVQQYAPKTETDTLPENVIGKTRKRRAGFSNFINFHTPEVPVVPPKGIETAMIVKFLQNFHLERVRRAFEQRPIWSKNALIYETKFTGEQLKILLPSVAYYFMTGPWRIMWVKLGYDPRKDPSARRYQTLDYRLKAMHGLEATVKCKRSYSNYILPYKSAPTSKPKTTVLTANLTEQSQKKEKILNENVYIYREGMVPPSRQMFYQYCDVVVEEIQEMLAKLPDPSTGTMCHEKMGWLPNGFDDQCREIINKQVRAVLRKRMNIPEDHPTTLPRKRRFGTKLKFGMFRNKRSKKSHLLNPDSSSIHMEVIPEGSDEEWEDDTGWNGPSTSREEL